MHPTRSSSDRHRDDATQPATTPAPARHHPAAVLAVLGAAGILLYGAAIIFVVGAIITTGCLMGCSSPSPGPGVAVIGGAAAVATSAAALVVWLVSSPAVRRVGWRGWRDTAVVLWAAACTWALWATGWDRLGVAGRGVWAAVVVVGAWRLAPGVGAVCRGRDPEDPLPLPQHLPVWARRTLRALAVASGGALLVVAWSGWSYGHRVGGDPTLGEDELRFLAFGLGVPLTTWIATSPAIERWVLGTLLALLVTVGPVLLLTAVGLGPGRW